MRVLVDVQRDGQWSLRCTIRRESAQIIAEREVAQRDSHPSHANGGSVGVLGGDRDLLANLQRTVPESIETLDLTDDAARVGSGSDRLSD